MELPGWLTERLQVRFQVLYVFLVLAHDRRRMVHFNVTAHPTAEWTAQQLREVFPLRCHAIAVAGLTPVVPDLGKKHPKQTVNGSQLRPFSDRTLKDPDLVSEGDVFQLQHGARTQHRIQRRQKSGQHDQHRITAIFSTERSFR